MTTRIRRLVVSAIMISGSIGAFAPSNEFRPYDAAFSLLRPRKNDIFKLSVDGEYGARRSGRNWDSKHKNVLALHDDSESAIGMVQEPVNATASLIAAQKQINPSIIKDDGKRGNIAFAGKYSGMNVNVNGSYVLPFKEIPGQFDVRFYVPVVAKKISDVTFTDLTVDDTSLENSTVKKVLTDNLIANAKSFGNLDLSAWEKVGLGDIAILLGWCNDYSQDKEFLKNVTLHAKAGLSLPTGAQRDEDKAFSMALGRDGSVGLPIGMGMGLDFVHHIRAGIDVDFLVLFDKTREMRLKTHDLQTGFLLMNKGRVTHERGLLWQFHLFLQAYRFVNGFSVGVDYQFVKQDNDRLNPRNNDFSFSLVNSVGSLKEWNVHNILFRAHYDFVQDSHDVAIAPQVGFFYKLPVAGKNVIDTHTIGGQLVLNF